MYTKTATSLTPALFIFLIDISDSMNDHCNRKEKQSKIEIVHSALKFAVGNMLRQSRRNGTILPSYKLALFAYNTNVYNLLGGIRTISEMPTIGIPVFEASGRTITEAGFAAVSKFLSAHLAEFQHCPAPLICHLTDGMFSNDPQALKDIVRDIKAMRVEDGNVLIENIYIQNKLLRQSVQDWKSWGGVLTEKQLTYQYAKDLFNFSSPLPDLYRQRINKTGYNLQDGASLFFPGTQGELLRLAMSII
jgi:hypothetical protein